MKRMIILALCLAVLAAPCIYDVTSQEPSLLASSLAVLGGGDVMAFAAE
jgi:hypothetical protein